MDETLWCGRHSRLSHCHLLLQRPGVDTGRQNRGLGLTDQIGDPFPVPDQVGSHRLHLAFEQPL